MIQENRARPVFQFIMANGHVIAEIRAILADDDPISAKVRDRLILAAISEIYDRVQLIPNIDDRLKDVEKEQDKRVEERKFYLRTTTGAAISAIVVLVINALIWFLKILPVLAKVEGG